MTEKNPNYPKRRDVLDSQSTVNQSSVKKKQVSEAQPEVPASIHGRTGSRGPLPLRIRDQILFAVISAFALCFMAAYCVRTSHWGVGPLELDRQSEQELDYKIDLNSATWVEWCQLRGIGPILAHRIVDDREKNGPFRTLDDLHRVHGIGPKKIEALRPFVRIESTDVPNRPAEAALPDGPAE